MFDDTQINDSIRASRVILIDDEGNKLGEFMLEDALSLAGDRGLDLVKVGENSGKVTCKLMDYGKWQYKMKKKQKADRAASSTQKVKELWFTLNTAENDLKILENKATKFLLGGDKVMLTLKLKGREAQNRKLISEKCDSMVERLGEVSSIETGLMISGKRATVILVPN